jgi:hypothetical protein
MEEEIVDGGNRSCEKMSARSTGDVPRQRFLPLHRISEEREMLVLPIQPR